MCRLLGIEQTRTSAYHPQGNGQVERFNRTLEAMLAKTVSENQRNWNQHLAPALFAYRTAVHESTGYTPFLLTNGRSPNLPVDVMLGRCCTTMENTPGLPQYVRDLQRNLQTAYSTVRQRLRRAHSHQKRLYDSKAVGASFCIGDCVWLFIPAVKSGRSRKFSSLWRGPYTVVDKLGPVNYRIQLLGTSRTLIVHRNRLKPCYGKPAPPRKPQSGLRHQTTLTATAAPPTQTTQITSPSYAEIVTRTMSAMPAGYTSSDCPSTATNSEHSGTGRPVRHRRQPDRYGNPISH